MPIKKINLTKILVTTTFAFLISFSSSASNLCDNNIKQDVESYLNSLSKAAIEFEQIGSNNAVHSGILLIDKPLKFRVNYDKPHPLVIVGGKNFISLYDFELDEISRVSANDNLFKFLLELDMSIEKTVKILSCTNFEDNIELNLVHTNTEQKAKINFSKTPFKIYSLVLPDDGNDFDKGSIELIFGQVIEVKSFPKEIFNIKDTKIYGAPKRYTTSEIQNLILKK